MDNQLIWDNLVTHQTVPITLLISLFHMEEIALLFTSSLANQIILGFP